MRIIAGEARGRRLFTPDGMDTRPTSDRVRESLFNVIARHIPDARVLDLFGGSGALSLEALSRGAQSVVINEPARAAWATIARNVEMIGWQARVTLIKRDWKVALNALDGPFDLVFLDPPYRMTDIYGQVAQIMRTRGLLSKDALLIMEHSAKAPLILPEDFVIVDTRHYGDTDISLVQQKL